uniref:Sugar phosphate transporter domain-containing protein n=2 Tax=Aegilops tauschii subsp. strangulata TaxID=200361 RepID=A0A453IBQ4_AEGTS
NKFRSRERRKPVARPRPFSLHPSTDRESRLLPIPINTSSHASAPSPNPPPIQPRPNPPRHSHHRRLPPPQIRARPRATSRDDGQGRRVAGAGRRGGCGQRALLHRGARHRLVLLQHRRAPAQQVPPQQLRLQVPNLPHHVPHVRLRALLLRRHRLAPDRAHAARALPRPARQDLSALSLVFCGSVVSGNVSLRYLPVSFNQAVGATTPFFTAVFAYIMTVKRESWITYLTLVPVVTGVVIASGVSYYLLPLRRPFSVDLLVSGLDLRGIQVSLARDSGAARLRSS